MSDNLIARLIPHQGCVITPKDDAIEIAGSAMNWVMSAAVAATAEQHSLKDKGFLTTSDWHEISWEIGLDRMRVIVDGDVRFDGAGNYSGIESAPSVGPCFGSTISVREFRITPLP